MDKEKGAPSGLIFILLIIFGVVSIVFNLPLLFGVVYVFCLFILSLLYILYGGNALGWTPLVILFIFGWIPLAVWDLRFASIFTGIFILVSIPLRYLVAKIEGREKRAKGLIKYRGKWGTPSEVERWKLEDFEKEQRAKGLVKYRNEWIPKLEAKRRFEAEQRAKGLVKFVDRHRREKWGTPEQVREWKRIDLGMQNNFEDLSPREFEEFIAKLFRVMGYQVELTSQVRDLGADIVARKGGDTIVVQVKKYSVGHNVSNREVQQTLGSMWKFKANKSVIITTSDFTVLAQEQAKEAPIELWNRETLFNLIEKYLLSL